MSVDCPTEKNNSWIIETIHQTHVNRCRTVSFPLRDAEVFHEAVRAAKIGADKDIPHISAPLIGKYVSDLKHLGLH